MIAALSSPGFWGALGSVLSFLHVIPQAIAVWRNRDDAWALRGQSYGMCLFLAGNAVIWFVYAGLLHEFWVGAPGIVNLPLTLSILWFKIRADRHHASGGAPEDLVCASCGAAWPGADVRRRALDRADRDLLAAGLGWVAAPSPACPGCAVRTPLA